MSKLSDVLEAHSERLNLLERRLSAETQSLADCWQQANGAHKLGTLYAKLARRLEALEDAREARPAARYRTAEEDACARALRNTWKCIGRPVWSIPNGKIVHIDGEAHIHLGGGLVAEGPPQEAPR